MLFNMLGINARKASTCTIRDSVYFILLGSECQCEGIQEMDLCTGSRFQIVFHMSAASTMLSSLL